MKRLHMYLLATWWALAFSAVAFHAWATSCTNPAELAELTIERVTIDGVDSDELSKYETLEAEIVALEPGIWFRTNGYNEQMVTP